ncbi:MAG TPA: transglutaminase family protein [Puia sp.]|jgi:transglutaminase-like putative cysteine protease|nr:transglutaminase family protein [Puia sp.]
MKYTIQHKTSYTYLEPVSLCHNIARLVPRNTSEQICKNTNIQIEPKPDRINEYEDFFGNRVIYFSIEKEHWELAVNVTSEVERHHSGQIKMQVYRNAILEEVKKEIQNLKGDSVDIRQYMFETPMTAQNEEILQFALESFQSGKSVFEATEDLTKRIFKEFEYKPGHTTVSTPLAQVMKERKGVCQDFAHLAISCIRAVGLPARYVSGYIETISPEGKEKLIGTDASHAWFSIYIPDMGWIDFDPTNNCIVSDQHITIGWGRDYADIAPLDGIILSSGSHELTVSVDVKRTN